MRSAPPREDELTKSPLRLQLPRPLPTMPQPALMLSSRHALTHAVATPARSGFPGAQVVSRQRLSICGTERQDILFHKNSCEPIVVETRKGSWSGPLLPQKRGVSVISPPNPPPACISFARTEQGCRIRHTGPVQRGQFGRLCPVAASRLQLSLEITRSYASERKAVNGTQLPLSEFILQKADVSIRASQGSSQAFTTPRLTTQSRRQVAYWHVPLHPATVHYLSFHLALPASCRLQHVFNVSNRLTRIGSV